ncbi:MAG: hypothetical protein ACR5LF_11310 [Symbiopectobacterium sp.]
MWRYSGYVDVRCPFCEQTASVKKHGYGKRTISVAVVSHVNAPSSSIIPIVPANRE